MNQTENLKDKDINKLMDAVNHLTVLICDLQVEVKKQTWLKREYRSPEVNELFAALAKAHTSMPAAAMDSVNSHYKNEYAGLTSIITTSRPSLSANGLSVLQQIVNEDGQSSMLTILAHSSGQWIQSAMRILPPKNDIQAIGSYITYIRRYTYAALIGVVTDDQSDDDDGEAAMATARESEAKGVALNTNYNSKQQTYDTITREQLEEIEYELSEFPDIALQVLDALRLRNLADMPKSKYHNSLKRIREIKQTRYGK
jgi:hypothetical protein